MCGDREEDGLLDSKLRGLKLVIAHNAWQKRLTRGYFQCRMYPSMRYSATILKEENGSLKEKKRIIVKFEGRKLVSR